ncbi:MAG: electron transfer flavoprotein subunit alpha/FixB family protein [Thermodesulfobacteriota bacterium]
MIIGLVEHDRGVLEESSLQMLTFARGLAARMETSLTAVLVGPEARPLAESLKPYGMSNIILAEGDRLEHYAPEAWARVVLTLMEERRPEVVLAPGTDRGNEVMGHVGAKADLPMAANCSGMHPGDPFKVTRLRWGSSLLEEAVVEGDPRLATVALHVMEPEEASLFNEPTMEVFSPVFEDTDFRVRVTALEETVADGITLKTAPVVIGGGRGVGSEEGYAVLEELAGLVGGAVGGSRVATNNGWRPHSDQIGLTGNRIAPELYIACGISGAIQHMVGCKGAKRILVINNDPEAALFSKADYGVIGDLHEVLPAIIREIKKG